MALSLEAEDRFALDTYSDPTLTVDEKLRRIREYGMATGALGGGAAGAGVTAGLAANDPTAPPVNDNGLPAIPAGPGIPAEATAELTGAPRVQLGGPQPSQMRLDAPPPAPASRVQVVEAPTGPFGSAIPQMLPIGSQLPGTPERKDVRIVDAPTSGDQFGLGSALPGNGLVLPTNEQVLQDARRANEKPESGAAKPGAVDPSRVQFGGATGGGSGGPVYAQVGTDEFQPYSRTIRAGIDPTIPIAGGEPEFDVAGWEEIEVVDPKTGKKVKKKVPAGLSVTGEPPQETPIESLITGAEQDELNAKRDIQEATDYAQQASLRAEQAAEDRARKIEEDAIKRANDRAAKLRQKEDEFQNVLRQVTDPNQPDGADAYFAKEGTPGRFAAGLAILFGEIGAAMRGNTSNTAKDIIFNAIDDEIKAGRERREMRVKGAQTAYDLARDQFQSEGLQDAAVKEMMLGRVAREAARFKQFAQTPERKAAIEEQIAFWEGQQLKATEDRQKLMQDEVVQQERFDPKRTVQVGGASGKDDDRIVRSQGQDVGFAPSSKRADVVQGQVDSLDALETELADLSRLSEEAKGNLQPQRVDDLKKQIAAKVNLVGAAISVAQQQGAMSEDERKLMTKSLGSAEDFVNFDLDSTPRVKQTLGYFQRKRSTILGNNVSDAPKGGRAVRSGRMPGSFEGKR